MDPTQLNRIRREVGTMMHELLIHLTQQDGRPVTAGTLAQVRDFGLRCYLQGLQECQTGPTLRAPPFPPAKDP